MTAWATSLSCREALRREAARAEGVALYVALRVAVPVVYRQKSLPALLTWIERRTEARGRRPAVSVAAVDATLARVDGLLRHVPGLPSTCLFRALGRYGALRALGHPAAFVMGVRPGAEAVEGHAWVEIAGAPLEDGTEVFTPSFVHHVS